MTAGDGVELAVGVELVGGVRGPVLADAFGVGAVGTAGAQPAVATDTKVSMTPATIPMAP